MNVSTRIESLLTPLWIWCIDSGQQLRQDDPSALKDIIGIVQTKLAGQDDGLRCVHPSTPYTPYSHTYICHPSLHPFVWLVSAGANYDLSSSRTRFMIETLTNLKNNKAKRTTAGQQHQGGEAVERMKKFLSALAKKRQGRSPAFAPFRSLQLWTWRLDIRC